MLGIEQKHYPSTLDRPLEKEVGDGLLHFKGFLSIAVVKGHNSELPQPLTCVECGPFLLEVQNHLLIATVHFQIQETLGSG
jgi:hypothetical protein